MYKLVAVDLDGTLLNSEKRISVRNKEAIRKAIDQGVHVVVCSGRIYAGAKIFGTQIGTKLPLITCNGARIKDMKTEEVIYSSPMQVELCKHLIDILQEEEVYFHTYVEDIMFTERLGFSSLFYWERNKELPEDERVDIRVIPCTKEILDQYPDEISKIVVISDNSEKLAKVRERIEAVHGVQVLSSNFDNFEIMNAGVSKGKALEFLAERFSVKKEEVIAIGDNENDISMLEYAGLPIAMANGEEYVKDVCKYVTLTNDEDGVAHALEKFILGK